LNFTRRVKLVQGNEACAEGALYAGCRFFAGYPITPSTEIAEILAYKLPQVNGKFIQMEDEIAAMAACIGASLAGAKSLTATSGPGFSLKQENIGFACMTEIPCVIINVMRGGPSTGSPTAPSQSDVMQARWGTHGDHPIICIAPSSVSEFFYETVRAFNLSEKYRVPVIIISDEIVGHMREKFIFPDERELEIINRKKPTCEVQKYLPYDSSNGLVPPMANFGEGYRFHVTGLNHAEDGFTTQNQKKIQLFQERLLNKINKNLDDILKYETYKLDDADTLIVAFGSVARSAKVAVDILREKNIKAGLFKPITIWPFCDNAFSNALKNIKKVVVPEMNLGQFIYEIERFFDKKDIIRINKLDEAISPDEIVASFEK
jgi:2-oxoglutarate ferredoxin oxidoreductase subunit alpha